MPSKYLAGVPFVFLFAACGGGDGVANATGGPMDMASDPALADQSMAPMFEVDPFWPKPLPNKWKMGGVIGLGITEDDSVWVYHRPRALEPSAAAGLGVGAVKPDKVRVCHVSIPVCVIVS